MAPRSGGLDRLQQMGCVLFLLYGLGQMPHWRRPNLMQFNLVHIYIGSDGCPCPLRCCCSVRGVDLRADPRAQDGGAGVQGGGGGGAAAAGAAGLPAALCCAHAGLLGGGAGQQVGGRDGWDRPASWAAGALLRPPSEGILGGIRASLGLGETLACFPLSAVARPEIMRASLVVEPM